jgi:hypothetical protein
METVMPPRKRGVSLIGAFFGMLITFLGGVFVGTHPSWIPIRWFEKGDSLGPTQTYVAPTTMPDDVPAKGAPGPTTLP